MLEVWNRCFLQHNCWWLRT